MKLAICTPIGPGHFELLSECIHSVAAAGTLGEWESDLIFVRDDNASMGRSAARNFLTQKASDEGYDWILWLDADDFLVLNSLPHLAESPAFLEALEGDAIWGTIRTDGVDREGQGYPTTYEEFVNTRPYYACQIGYFIRTEVQLAEPFAENLKTGEDYEMYLRLWKRYRCKKIKEVWYDNQRGRHSSVSPSGRQWSMVVTAMQTEAKRLL